MEQLKSAIYSVSDLGIVKEIVGGLSRPDIEREDEHGLDVLHHAILANYSELVHYVLLRGYFPERGVGSGPSYVHLACLLGHTYIVNILLDSWPHEFYRPVDVSSWIDWAQVSAAVELRYGGSTQEALIKSTLLIAQVKMQNTSCEQVIPLDVAAIVGHTNSVKLLLSSSHSKLDSKCMLETAVKLNSPRTLNLLLTTEPQNQCVLDEAVKAALRRKEPECLKLLLKHGANIIQLFHGLNPYHVMYMYSSAYMAPNAPCRNTGMDESTSVLISFKQDVNTRLPLGSFPLYSLLHSLVYEKDQDPNKVPIYHINAFHSLLEAGADVNFDEVEYSEIVSDNTMTIGRDLFTSALNALFSSLSAASSWKPLMNDHLDKCCLLLLEAGAKPNHLDSYGETPLHDLMKLWAMQHATGHMHVDLTNMAAMMLKYGADPNLQSSNGLYPVHYYFKIIFNVMGGHISYQRWINSNKPARVIRLLSVMRTDAALESYRLILQNCAEAMEDGLPESVTEYIHTLGKYLVLEPKPLTYLCQLEIWQATGRRLQHMEQLPLPNRFKHDLKTLFDPVDE